MSTPKSSLTLGMLLIAVVTIFNIDNVTADPVAVMIGYDKLFTINTYTNQGNASFIAPQQTSFSGANGIQLSGITDLLSGGSANVLYSRCTQDGFATEFPIMIVLAIDASKCAYDSTAIGCKQSATLGEVTTLLNCVLKNTGSLLSGVKTLTASLTSSDLGKAVQVILFLVYALLIELLNLVENLNVSNLLYPFLPIILGAVVFFLGLGLFASVSQDAEALGFVVLVVYSLLMPLLSPVFYLLAKTTTPVSTGLTQTLKQLADSLRGIINQ